MLTAARSPTGRRSKWSSTYGKTHNGGLPDLQGLMPTVDIAVVPNLFGASTRTHDSTRDHGG